MAERKFQSAEEAAEEMEDRFIARRCMVCGAESGSEPLLPPGWSFLVYGEAAAPDMQGKIAAFFCPDCAGTLDVPEARNYGKDLN